MMLTGNVHICLYAETPSGEIGTVCIGSLLMYTFDTNSSVKKFTLSSDSGFIMSPDESQGYIGFRSVAPPP